MSKVEHKAIMAAFERRSTLATDLIKTPRRSTRRVSILATISVAFTAAVTLPAYAARSPDAELIQACAAFIAFYSASPVPLGPERIFGSPECDAHEDKMEAWVGEAGNMICIIADMPAFTLEGMRAKAKALLVWNDEVTVPQTSMPVDVLTASLLGNLIGGAV